MFTYNHIEIDGRSFRWSDERRVSGRPASIQFLNGRNEWRDVRNVDRSDRLWEIADDQAAVRDRLAA